MKQVCPSLHRWLQHSRLEAHAAFHGLHWSVPLPSFGAGAAVPVDDTKPTTVIATTMAIVFFIGLHSTPESRAGVSEAQGADDRFNSLSAALELGIRMHSRKARTRYTFIETTDSGEHVQDRQRVADSARIVALFALTEEGVRGSRSRNRCLSWGAKLIEDGRRCRDSPGRRVDDRDDAHTTGALRALANVDVERSTEERGSAGAPIA